jgi:hypothetical protein
MTAIRRDGGGSPFGDWIRNRPELDSIKQRLCVIDRDWWIHQYAAHTDRVGARAVDSIFVLEEKSFCADLSYAQRDTLFLVDQMLRATDFVKIRSYRRLRGPFGEKRIVRCFGVCRLRMIADRPDNSEWMAWNGINIDEMALIEILRFERDPQCPNKHLEYRRHHTPSAQQLHPSLFAIAPR